MSPKADAEGAVSRGEWRADFVACGPSAPAAASEIDIPPMPNDGQDVSGTAVVDGAAESSDASASRLKAALLDGIADAPSVTSDKVSERGPTSDGQIGDANPADVSVLPAPTKALEVGDGDNSDGALSGGTRGVSSDVAGPSATLTEEEVPERDHAPDRHGPMGRDNGPVADHEDADSGGGTGSSAASPLKTDPDAEASSLDRIFDALSDPSSWVEASTPDVDASLRGTSSVHETESAGPVASNGLEGSPVSVLRASEDAEPTIIALPDLSGEGAGDIDDGFLRHVADVPAVSSDRPAGGDGADASKLDDVFLRDAGSGSDEIGASDGDRARWTGSTGKTTSSLGETAAPVPASDGERLDGDGRTTPTAFVRAEAPSATAEDSLDDRLILSIVDAPSVRSDGVNGPTPVSSDETDGEHPEEIDDTPAIPVVETAFDSAPPDRGLARPEAPDGRDGAEFHDIPFETVPPGPSRALAFAADPDTEAALRDGLLDYEGSSPGHGDPQVWQGGLRAAIAALTEGHSAPLIFVDIDRTAYPAGAIHELAAVCEVGTVVIALGSDNSARPSRELLIAGVSDYLAKPLTAEAVRAAAGRAAPDAAARRSGGRVAGFIGCGGSGATTLLTAAALQAAERGRYVSVLDLDRSVAAAALALGVEPAAGLDQLLEAAGSGTPDSEMVEGVCTRRSDRIHVYAHRWGPTLPAIPSPAALDSLLAVLRDRSQLVLVDGLNEPVIRFSPSSEFDARVFVAEPTAWNVAHLGRTTNLLGGDPPLLFVQNHTRAFRRGRGERALRNAGLGITPDITIPFEPVLPEATDRGWPQPRLPRSLRKPMRALTDRLLEPSHGLGAGIAAHPTGRA